MKRELDRQYLKGPVGGTTELPPGRPLAVLIVGDRGHGTLETCLAGVAEHLPELPVYAYDDGHRAELAGRHPHVHWVSGTVKLGFAEAFNALVEHAPSDADLLLLDARARVLGALTRTRALLRRPRVAAVSPMARDDTAPGWAPWDIATRRRTLVRELAAGYPRARRGSPITRLYARQPAESQGVEGELDATCLAINRAAWNAVGGFDEEFSWFGAAADWQARARVAGWRMLLADELGVDRAPVGADEGSAAERGRERDLARADTALLLEHQHSVHHADMYLAGTTLLGRWRRDPRRAARAGRRTDLPAIVITTNRLVYGGAERQKALLATELDRRGYAVTIVCVQRFGPMISELPDTVRVVRQPWWAPVVDLPEGPAVLITADTNTEAGFATLWRAAAPAGAGWSPRTFPPSRTGPSTHGR